MKLNTKKYTQYLGNIALALIVLIVIFEALPIKVLSNWSIHVDDGAYKSGQIITLHSKYEKHYNLAPSSDRSLQCKTPNGFQEYPIYFGYSGNGVGKNSVNTSLYLPEVSLEKPVQCRVHVHVLYFLLGIKPINQDAFSNYFWITK